MALAAFMEVLDTSIANVSLQHIAGNLSASSDEATWVLTSYLVTNAIILPMSAWLSNTLGRKRFFISCIIGFTVASLLCGLSTSLPMLIIFEPCKVYVAAVFNAVAQSVLIDTFPKEKRGMAYALYGISVMFAPAIG